MSITILKDVLISKGQVDRIFEGSVPINLWRALNKKSNTEIFNFIEEPTILSNGRPRAADIKIEQRNGVKWVSVKNRPRGLSTFDKPGLPKGKDWEYYKIPKGTLLPEGIAIVKDEYNTVLGAHHYTIAPAYDMPLSQFKAKLDQLAIKLLKEAI